jgi:hypothetical protein
MNERIKQLAEQAGVLFDTDPTYTYGASPKVLERFAELVRQEEREACAKLCEDINKTFGVGFIVVDHCAAAIRGRTE